jgi:hypothetical protein
MPLDMDVDGALGSLYETSGVLGVETADVIQKKILVPLRNYRSKDNEMDDWAVHMNVKSGSEHDI